MITLVQGWSEKNKLLNLTRLKVFGCAATILNHLDKFPKKYKARSIEGYIFIGINSDKV